MRDQLIQYVRLLFAGTPDSYDIMDTRKEAVKCLLPAI